jgi:hypothetical protein
MPAIPTLAVSALFCLWNAYRHLQASREQLLRRRVACLLWVMATGTDLDWDGSTLPDDEGGSRGDNTFTLVSRPGHPCWS